MSTKNKSLLKIFLLTIEIFFYYWLFIYGYKGACIIKSHLGVNCPGCGLTRAFKAIFRLDFLEALNYNILSIPLFMFLIIFNLILAYDIFFKKDKLFEFLYKCIKICPLFLALIIIQFIIGNI